jgi:hypothetical protein
MAFIHKGIEYYLGGYASKFTVSIPQLKNYFKEIEVTNIKTAHSRAQTTIEDEISRISKEKDKNTFA